MIVLLDSGPLGLLAHLKTDLPVVRACQIWLDMLLQAKHTVVVPEITDYEVRRELLRMRKSRSIARLDELGAFLEYMPISTAAMREAAQLWAHARQRGLKTATDDALDADMILAAHARIRSHFNSEPVVIATTNTRHLALFADARAWPEVR